TCAQIPDECQGCGCCAYGNYRKCDNNGNCNNGCQDGYWGDKCYKKCKYNNCFRCARNNGYHCECRTGYYGFDCESWCGTNCAGYYGNVCTKTCSVGCMSTCNQIDGSCTCKAGWAGDRCDTCADIYMCNEQCRSSCLTCTGDLNCQLCKPGYYGDYCQYICGKGCINDSCDINSESGYCTECVSGKYGLMCEQRCPKMCNTCENETYCRSCNEGYFGESCKKSCPDGCRGNTCRKKDGSCFTCKPGYFGKNCGSKCPESCQVCDQYDSCSECKAGYSNTQKQCTCRTDICVESEGCNSCTNISYYANANECCLCSIDNYVSCTKTIYNINCKTCRRGYFLHLNGQCKKCNSQCINNECDPSSGRCLQGCTLWYWNQTCDKVCDPECVSCNQTDGLNSQCKNNTKYGPFCTMECNNTCKNSMCDINGNCTNGCITNTFGKQCENTCDEHCTPNENKTICSEKTGMCFYGCQTEYKGRIFIETEAGKQNWPIAALGVGIAGGVVVLAAIVVVGLFFLRRRRVNLKIKSKANEKEPENLLEMYPNVNNGRTTRAKNPKGDTDNFHSVTVIGIPNSQSPPTNRSGNERTPILTEDNLEIDEDDASAKETAVIFEENGGFYYNNAEEISKIKLHVTDLPEYVHNLCFKDLEKEFQKIPYGLMMIREF
ncbi:TENX-like protein, partial [Mya arenaria]